MNVTVAELTLSPGPAPAAMVDAGFDAETTRLAQRAQQGDADAFSALVELHQRAARRVAVAALGNLADADEAVQDACLVAWRRLQQLDDPAAFRAWLLRITWRKALDRRRSLTGLIKRFRRERDDDAEVMEQIPASGGDPDTVLLARERDRAVARMIRSLPARLRDPLLLAAGQEHRYEDIAVMLGVPVGTVKWRIVEARRMLKDKLQRAGFGDRG
jgi:RNA polymerase sigma-70 factor (ECF subfamily)